jgi:hypothetical protein
MRRSQRLGLDELMIVNPGRPGRQKGLEMRRLGASRVLRRMRPVGPRDRRRLEQRRGQGLGRFFLGGDDTLYEVVE